MRKLAISLILASTPTLGCAGDIASVRYVDLGDQVEVSLRGTGTTAQTPFVIASLGKTMTAVAVLRRVERGSLPLARQGMFTCPRGASR
jgi:hypothetical protein